jgi:hypothetical protein
MRKRLHIDQAAEQEATDIGSKFMNSSDVVGDMSRAYHTDLSSVRIHTDGGAAQQAADRGVDAFSTGKDVFFARGAFNQSDPASRGLLAHELSHSMQQGVGGDSSAVSQSAPVGEAQGGLLDWFRNLFKKKKPVYQIDRSEGNAPRKDTSPESQEYMRLMRERSIELASYPEAKLGTRGDQSALQNLDDVLHKTFIPASNEGFGDGSEGKYSISRSLVSLGLRGNILPKYMEGVRGSLFKNMLTDHADYMDSLDAQGVDFDAVMSGLNRDENKFLGGSKEHYMNNALSPIASNMLAQFGKYATSDGATSYFKDVASKMKDAKVFNEGGKNVYDAVVEELMLRYGAMPSAVSVRRNQRYDAAKAEGRSEAELSQLDKHEGKKVAAITAASQTLMSLPAISPDAVDSLPPQVKSLYIQYQNIVEQIKKNIADSMVKQ